MSLLPVWLCTSHNLWHVKQRANEMPVLLQNSSQQRAMPAANVKDSGEALKRKICSKGAQSMNEWEGQAQTRAVTTGAPVRSALMLKPSWNAMALEK